MLIKTNDTALYMLVHLLAKLHLNLGSICKSLEDDIDGLRRLPPSGLGLVCHGGSSQKPHSPAHYLKKQLWNRKCLCLFSRMKAYPSWMGQQVNCCLF